MTRSPEGRQRRHARALAAVLSTLMPGAGQMYNGDRRKGAVLLGVSGVLVAVALVMVMRGSRTLLKLAFEPSVLIALLFANAGLFLFRAVATIDAFRGGRGQDERRWVNGVAVSFVAVALIVPHAWFAYYDAVQYDVINTVFAAPATTTTTTIAPTTTTTTAVPATAAPGDTSATVASTMTTTTTTTTTTLSPALWDGLDRLNILLLGSDSGVGRTGVRTDTMILASLDVDTGDLALISIPRNFARVPLPEEVGIFSCDCFPPILNELYQYAEDRPDSFPGPATPGANAIKGAVSELTGLPVHYYALVSLDGFIDVVDAVGGVTIAVTESIYDPAYPNEDGTTSVVNLQPGTYDFNGHEALIYVRSRYSSDDYDRMGRQRCVVEAVVEQADPFTLLRNYPKLAEVIKGSVETDIPLDAVPDLIDLAAIVDADRAVSLRLVPPTYIAGWTEDQYNIPDVGLIHEHAAIVTTLSPEEAMEALGLDPLGDACG